RCSVRGCCGEIYSTDSVPSLWMRLINRSNALYGAMRIMLRQSETVGEPTICVSPTPLILAHRRPGNKPPTPSAFDFPESAAYSGCCNNLRRLIWPSFFQQALG